MAKPYLAYSKGDQFFANDGTVLNGGSLNFYQTGTTDALTVYTSASLDGTNTSGTVTLNTYGRPAVDIYVTSGYKVILKDSSGNTLWTVDNVSQLAQQYSISSTKSSSYTVLSTDRDALIPCDATSGAFNVILTSAVTLGSGFVVIIKKIDSSSNEVTIDPAGSETIDGDATIALGSQYNTVVLISNGTNWYKISPLYYMNA